MKHSPAENQMTLICPFISSKVKCHKVNWKAIYDLLYVFHTNFSHTIKGLRLAMWSLLHDTVQLREMLSTDQSLRDRRSRGYESVLVPHSSLKCNSKFPVGMSKFPVWRSRNFELLVGYIVVPAYWLINHLPKSKFRVWTRNFQLGCRNFQFAEVEISSLNSKFPVGMSKFPVCRCRNFQFADVEISSFKSKFPVCRSRNFQFAEVEISSLNSKFPVGMSKFPVRRSLNFQFGSRNFQFGTRNFHFELEISSLTKSKFRVVGWLYSCSSVLVH